MGLRTSIFDGIVVHSRLIPKKHNFKYRVFSLLIDLDDLEEINNKMTMFSYNKFNIISFFDKDHGARDGTSLKNWVKQSLKNIGIDINKKLKGNLLNIYDVSSYDADSILIINKPGNKISGK